MRVWRATVEWYWQGKAEEVGERSVPLPLCPPPIDWSGRDHGLPLAINRLSHCTSYSASIVWLVKVMEMTGFVLESNRNFSELSWQHIYQKGERSKPGNHLTKWCSSSLPNKISVISPLHFLFAPTLLLTFLNTLYFVFKCSTFYVVCWVNLFKYMSARLQTLSCLILSLLFVEGKQELQQAFCIYYSKSDSKYTPLNNGAG
jgi:hypothetical protein